ncbi:MAG TPA: VOC family protein [Solirubrobacteraceae bacterium]|nr:VOC family protein [Solirubrobacteraceae bacterium]
MSETPPVPPPHKPVTGLDHVVIAVSDWELSNAFYRDVVGAEVVHPVPGEPRAVYRIGEQQLNVHGPGMDPSPVARIPAAPGMADLCFVWNGTAEEAVSHLMRQGVDVEDGPVTRHGAQGEGVSVYFRDPDGALLELLTYVDGT